MFRFKELEITISNANSFLTLFKLRTYFGPGRSRSPSWSCRRGMGAKMADPTWFSCKFSRFFIPFKIVLFYLSDFWAFLLVSLLGNRIHREFLWINWIPSERLKGFLRQKLSIRYRFDMWKANRYRFDFGFGESVPNFGIHVYRENHWIRMWIDNVWRKYLKE